LPRPIPHPDCTSNITRSDFCVLLVKLVSARGAVVAEVNADQCGFAFPAHIGLVVAPLLAYFNNVGVAMGAWGDVMAFGVVIIP
jgi:hypothetical protein